MQYMTEEEKMRLNTIDGLAKKLDEADQNRAIGWLMCMTAIRKEEQKGA